MVNRQPERRSHRTGNHSNLLNLLLARNTIVHQLDVRFWAFPSRHFSIFFYFILFYFLAIQWEKAFSSSRTRRINNVQAPLFPLSLDITRPYMASLGPNTSCWLEPNGLEQTPPPFEQASNPVTSASMTTATGVLLFLSSWISTHSHFLFFLVLIKDTWRGGLTLTVGFFLSFHDCGTKKKKKKKRNAWGGMGHPAQPRSACQVDRQGNMASWQARQKAIARETARLEAILKIYIYKKKKWLEHSGDKKSSTTKKKKELEGSVKTGCVYVN